MTFKAPVTASNRETRKSVCVHLRSFAVDKSRRKVSVITSWTYAQKTPTRTSVFTYPAKSFLSPGSAVAFFLVLFFLCITPMAFGATRYTVYFYNPESNIDNFASLKTRLDVYLKEAGPYQFQPFCDRETFEVTIRNKRDCVFIISSWYYKELRDSFPMEPMLVGTVDGKSFQKKILSSKININNLMLLKNAGIASAGSEEYTRKYLKSMVGEEYAGVVDTCQILAVPKDIDALISVGFGLVQAALTTEYSISKLSSINPGLHKKLTLIVKSGESLQPIVAVPEANSPEVTKLLQIIEGMGKTDDGRNCLQMFGIDGWQKPGKSEWELLRK